ncbi:MAG: dipeptide ABC transporter ATP-binding protein [Firmicutes bacterium]|nr:dipeptide ABC transporter ATP-binding protein [Bacillota bacterium]
MTVEAVDTRADEKEERADVSASADLLVDAADSEILLDVKGLKKHFPILGGVFRRPVGWVKAVDGVDFQIRRGETLGLVGESGCGKTTTGRCIIHLEQPTAGVLRFNRDGQWVNVNRRTISSLRKDIQIIFQDPYSSLSPRMKIRDIIAEPLEAQGMKSRRGRYERVEQLLEAVGMKPSHMNRYPHEFSGGQRQRIGIARALALNPSLVICDEPVSALDVSIQAQVLNLLEDLQQQFGLTYLFIAHNLSVVQHISDRVAVMYLGRIVELADVESLFRDPRHPYTEALFSAIPVPDPDFKMNQIILQGDVPSASNPPSGCHFHPRCRYAIDICRTEAPSLTPVDGDAQTGPTSHFVSCHRYRELDLAGIEVRNGA